MEKPIVILGGGPAGASAANVLSQHGHSVLLLEKDRMPRFHIGESLLPVTQGLWSRLGLTDVVNEAGFVKKTAGEIRLGRHPDRDTFHPSRMLFKNVPRDAKQDRPWSFHVERARFDAMVLEQAKVQGADVREDARVLDVKLGAEPEVVWKDADGATHTTAARFVIDASGRHAFLSRKLGLFTKETLYRTSSVFGHFRGVSWAEGLAAGYINVYVIEDGWVWFIPQTNGITSVGLVMNHAATQTWPRSPEQVLYEAIGRYAYLQARFENAEQCSPIRILRNLPYYSSKVVGEGWALVGDAAFFVDPIHSSGVQLAFYSGTSVADAVHAHLAGDAQALDQYARKLHRHHTMVRYNVSLYYKVVVKYRAIAWLFVKLTGDWVGHWRGPWFRRVNAWSFGHYSRYPIAMWSLWSFAHIGAALCAAFHGLTRIPRWGQYGYHERRPRPFSLPRSTQASEPARSAAVVETDSHLEPQEFEQAV